MIYATKDTIVQQYRDVNILVSNSFYLCVLLLRTCVSLVLAGVYCVPRLARACTVRSRVTHKGFSFVYDLAKTCVYGCANAIHVILNVGTVRASIKSKSSCTVARI